MAGGGAYKRIFKKVGVRVCTSLPLLHSGGGGWWWWVLGGADESKINKIKKGGGGGTYLRSLH